MYPFAFQPIYSTRHVIPNLLARSSYNAAIPRQPRMPGPVPSKPPRLILGSSLVKNMTGIKSTRIQAIPGAHFNHLEKWALSQEGRYELNNKIAIILLCGGNSLANGRPASSVLLEAKQTATTIKHLAPPQCRIYISTLPPRPQIDTSSNSRIDFNDMLLKLPLTENFLTTDAELGLVDQLTNIPKPIMLNQAEFRDKPRRDIVHLSSAGLTQLRRNYIRTLGKARHGRPTPPFVIKKNEIGHLNSYHIH
jgi:hypothetical protein